MASGVVYVEGKSFSLDQEIIDAGIPAIKAALSVDVPDIENAEITLNEPKAPGLARTAEISKRGMGKGGLTGAQRDVFDRLARAPEHVNPAISLAVRLQQAEAAGDASALALALRSGELGRAVEAGEREGQAVKESFQSLYGVGPVAARSVPEGF